MAKKRRYKIGEKVPALINVLNGIETVTVIRKITDQSGVTYIFKDSNGTEMAIPPHLLFEKGEPDSVRKPRLIEIYHNYLKELETTLAKQVEEQKVAILATASALNRLLGVEE